MQDNSNTTKSRIEIAPQFVYNQSQQMMSTNIDTGRMLKLDGYENLIKVNLLDIIDGVAIVDADAPCAYVHQCPVRNNNSPFIANNNVQVSSLMLELVTSSNKLVGFEDEALKLFCCTKLIVHTVRVTDLNESSLQPMPTIVSDDVALKVAFVTRKSVINNNRLVRSSETLKARLQNLVQKAKKVISK